MAHGSSSNLIQLRGVHAPGDERAIEAELLAEQMEDLVEARDTIPDGLEPPEGPEEWFEKASDTIPAPVSAAPETLPTLPRAGRVPSEALETPRASLDITPPKLD